MNRFLCTRLPALIWMWTMWVMLLVGKYPMFYFGGIVLWGIIYLGHCVDDLKSGSLEIKIKEVPKKKEIF